MGNATNALCETRDNKYWLIAIDPDSAHIAEAVNASLSGKEVQVSCVNYWNVKCKYGDREGVAREMVAEWKRESGDPRNNILFQFLTEDAKRNLIEFMERCKTYSPEQLYPEALRTVDDKAENLFDYVHKYDTQGLFQLSVRLASEDCLMGRWEFQTLEEALKGVYLFWEKLRRDPEVERRFREEARISHNEALDRQVRILTEVIGRS